MWEFRYLTSLFLFYLKGVIKIDQNKIITIHPNTILKFIPLGKSKNTFTIAQVNDASNSFCLNFKTFLIGIILSIIGFSTMANSFLIGLIFIIVGIMNVINSFEIKLSFSMSSGKVVEFNFFIFEKSKASEITEIIDLMIEQRTMDTNHRVQTEKTNEIFLEMLNKK